MACSARHSCLPPTSSTATARELGAASQRLLLQEATTQSQLSGRAADTSLSVLYFTPGTSPGSSRKRGKPGVSSLRSSCPVRQPREHREPVCLSVFPGVFHRSRCDSSCDQQPRNHWIQLSCLPLITTNLVFPGPFW